MPPAVLLDITVTPNARRTEIVEKNGQTWKVRLAEKPIDGAANDALIELVASELGVAKSLVEITRGHRSRRKRIRVILA